MIAINKGKVESKTPKTLHIHQRARERLTAVKEKMWQIILWNFNTTVCTAGHCKSDSELFQVLYDHTVDISVIDGQEIYAGDLVLQRPALRVSGVSSVMYHFSFPPGWT